MLRCPLPRLRQRRNKKAEGYQSFKDTKADLRTPQILSASDREGGRSDGAVRKSTFRGLGPDGGRSRQCKRSAVDARARRGNASIGSEIDRGARSRTAQRNSYAAPKRATVRRNNWGRDRSIRRRRRRCCRNRRRCGRSRARESSVSVAVRNPRIVDLRVQCHKNCAAIRWNIANRRRKRVQDSGIVNIRAHLRASDHQRISGRTPGSPIKCHRSGIEC
jgi:hypothetical protein